MSYFALYLDESGKVHKDDFTSLCGYVGTIEEWSRFGMDWDNLRFKWQVPPIHMARIMYPDRKDDKWSAKYENIPRDIWDSWRDGMLEEFAQVVQHGNIVATGAVVDSDAYRRIKNQTDCNLCYDDPNVFALQYAIMSALDKIETVDKNPSVTVIIDDDEGSALGYYSSLVNLRTMINNPLLPSDMKVRFERIKRCVHGIAFCNDAYYPPLQAADMLSYVSRRFKVEQKIGPGDLDPSDLYAFLTRGGLNQPKFYPEPILYRVARSTAKKLEEAERQKEQDRI